METTNRVSYKKSAVIALGVLVGAVLCFALFYYAVTVPKIKNEKRIAKHYMAYYESLYKNSPGALQDLFVDDVKNGINDMYTKSDAYFVTQRFLLNGGGIYEIYDYVGSHPELTFLKEAEVAYPSIFEQMKKRAALSTFRGEAAFAYLAYLEVLEKHGYADIAMFGTHANQYVKMAYFAKTISLEMPNKTFVPVRTKYVESDTKKALELLELVKGEVADILDGKITANDIPPQDILMGLDQYAAALRYLEGLGTDVSFSPKTSKEIFAFTMDYAQRFVPEWKLYTSLLNASTLVLSDSSDSNEIKAALGPILAVTDAERSKLVKGNVAQSIIDTRLEKKPQFIRDTPMGIFSKRNTLLLAEKVPEFKAWLVANGWGENDFK